MADLPATCEADFLDADAKRRANRQKLVEARQRACQTRMIVTHIRNPIAEAERVAEQDRRTALYANAKAKSGDPLDHAKAYDRAARALLATVRALAEAQLATAAANAELPGGAEPLPNADEAITLTAGLPPES